MTPTARPDSVEGDIVERLRDYRPTNEWGDGIHHVICTEAADHIAALRARCEAFEGALQGALEWIDALPADVVASLPAMPGFDRDYVDGLLSGERADGNAPLLRSAIASALPRPILKGLQSPDGHAAFGSATANKLIAAGLCDQFYHWTDKGNCLRAALGIVE